MDNSIRVVHSTNTWLPLTEAWLYFQVSNLPETVISHVACRRTTNLERFAIMNLHEMPPARSLWPSALTKRARFANWRFRRHLRKVVREQEAQILHSHFGHRAWSDMAALASTDTKHVATFYGYDVSQLPVSNPHWIERYGSLFERVDLVLCEGPHMALSVQKLGCPPGKIRVHHLGVPVEEIAYVPRRRRKSEPLRVLIAASFTEKKGIPVALEALGVVAGEIPIEVTIIGDAGRSTKRQDEKAKILNAIERNGLTSQVRLLGYVPHEIMLEEAYRHHVFLSPSMTASDGDSEGGAPITLIEMAASGMLIVSTTHCDIPEVIEHGVSGLLAQEGDVQSLAAYIIHLADNPDCWDSMTKAARTRIGRDFDARIQGQKLAGIYWQIVNEEG